MARKNARRLGQQKNRYSGSVPCSRWHPGDSYQRGGWTCGLSESNRGTRCRRTALYGHRKHNDGCGEGRRQQAGAARENKAALTRSLRTSQETRQTQRPGRPPESGHRLRQSRFRENTQSRCVHRPVAAAGRRIHQNYRNAHPQEIPKSAR